jgi:hypothetical protein
MQWMLQTIGFKCVEHFRSDDIPYPACLVKATRDILQKYIDEPVLILEDDLAYTDQCLFEIPDDADAMYLGLSEVGAHPIYNCDSGQSQFQYVSQHTVRIINMLSAHAVLYKSRRYKEAVIESMNNALENKTVNDIHFTRLQPRFNIYGGVKPMFYQSRVFNMTPSWNINVEDQTNIEIHITEDKKCIPVRRYGGKTDNVKYKHELGL